MVVRASRVVAACCTVLLMLAAASSGCDAGPETGFHPSAKRAPADLPARGPASSSDDAQRKKSTRQARGSANRSDENWLPPLRMPDGPATGAVASNWQGGAPFTESDALDRIERELADALSVRPTLVVWLLDQSAAAGTLRRATADAAVQAARRLSRATVADHPSGDPGSGHEFLTAMIAFGSKVNVLTGAPVSKADELPSSGSISEEASSATQTLAAVKKAAELFAKYRERHFEVIFVLAAYAAADDESSFIAAQKELKKWSVPVFAIGPAAPFGRLADALNPKTLPIDMAIAAECRHAERIRLYFPGNEGDAELTDSGFGPFHLERICRLTGGQYLRLRTGGAPGWKIADDGEVPPALLRKYTPDYVSEDEYRRLLNDNRACRAIYEAAQLPPARVLAAPAFDFPKQEEGAMNRTLSVAQRASAENQIALERLHQTLAAGEADRDKLTSPRWQAAFDLAYGRACAARARNEGYNYMLAVLKNGKPFTKPGSTTWSLKPADGIPGSSDLDKIARKARVYLQRVVNEHPGTPWAAAAARDLATPCGWEWTER
jgi:hypothetical protein